jgi:hypothetical protein
MTPSNDFMPPSHDPPPFRGREKAHYAAAAASFFGGKRP